MNNSSINRSDAAAGVLFILIGLVFAIQAFGLELGTALRMGPGMFPLILAVVLVLLGGAILFSAFRSAGEEFGRLALRGMICILPAPVIFGLTVRGLGFVPAVFLTTLIASQASPKMRPLEALLLAAGVTVFSTLVFSYGLGLPFRRLGPWLGF